MVIHLSFQVSRRQVVPVTARAGPPQLRFLLTASPDGLCLRPGPLLLVPVLAAPGFLLRHTTARVGIDVVRVIVVNDSGHLLLPELAFQGRAHAQRLLLVL